MNAQTKLNLGSIIGINDGINEIFSLINQCIDSFSQNPDDENQLEACRNYIHQLNGFLKMLELRGISVVSQKMEMLLESLLQKTIQPEPQLFVVLKQTSNALFNYINEQIDGAEENPLRLYPVYWNLMQAHGSENVLMSDLFFSHSVAALPLPAVSPLLDTSGIKTLAKQLRVEYQTGLLKWLRNNSHKEGLQQMINAISPIEEFPGSIEQRSFWWIAGGFLKGLLQQDSGIDLAIRRLCGKIEQEIRRLAEGEQGSPAHLMHEIVYQIIQSELQSERIREIYQAFEWSGQLVLKNKKEDALLIDAGALHIKLEAMRNILTEVNDNWRDFSTGKQECLISMITNIEKLKSMASHVNHKPLDKLIAVVNSTLAYLRIRPQDMSENLAEEMAASLLLVETILDNFNKLPLEIPEQIEAVSVRLRAITTGNKNNSGLPRIPGPYEIRSKIQKKKLQTQAAQEILINLAQIESVLDKYFLDPAIRSDLPTLEHLFKQISGMLIMLDLEQANHLLNLCHDLVKRLSKSDYEITQPEQSLLVEGLSSLSFFIETLRSTQPDNIKIIEAAISLFDNTVINKTKPATSVSIANTIASVGQSQRKTTQTEVDSDLLDTFLEEADDVLATIASNLQHCRNNPANSESLTALRRGFHTLKGSGRMVKLQGLSEIAWTMEQVLNHWLNKRKAATHELIDLVSLAHREFSLWCNNLKATGITEIHAEEILQSARNLINTARTDESEKESYNQKIATIEYLNTDKIIEHDIQNHITIGSITIPFDLFEIFKTESDQHLTTLKNELRQLTTQQHTTVSQPAMLAVHTLASISHTLKLTFIADLGFTLEQWFSELGKYNSRLDTLSIQLIQNTIELMDSMLKKIHHQQLPAESDLQRVKGLLEKLAQRLERAEQKAENVLAPEQIVLAGLSSTTETTAREQSLGAESSPEDESNPELKQIFIDEAQTLLPQIGSKLRAWRILPQDRDIQRALLRLLHTLKGNAHTASALQLGELIHGMESNVEVAFNEHTVTGASIDKLENQLDAISEEIEQLQNTLQIGRQTEPIIQQEITRQAATTASLPAQQCITESESSPAWDDEIEIPIQKTVLRINSDLIDHLVNESGEASIIRSKIEAQLYYFKQSLLDHAESVERLQSQLREIEIQAETQIQAHLSQTQESEQAFDPLEFDRFTHFQELTRHMAETVDDIVTVQQNLRTTHAATEEAVKQQALLNRKLQQALMRIRTVPFKQFAEHYYRIVRQTAKELGKKASLHIEGDETEVDRNVLEKINSSLEHLLRNAVAHGIEEPVKRKQLNKPETGQISICLHQQGNELIIKLSDDGSGLDITGIHTEALKRGLIQENVTPNKNQIMSLVFTHGFSTIKEVSGIAGRGVGMDIVKNEISALGGYVTIHSECNQGTTFNINLPLTLAVEQAQLVRSSEQFYAVPTLIVEQIQEINAEALKAAYRTQRIDFNEENYPFTHFSHLLGEIDHAPEIKRHNRLLLLQSGTLRLALHVDEMIGSSEVVVKNIGPQMAHAPGVEGATVMGNGEAILIINPLKLLQHDSAKKIFSVPLAERTYPTHKKASHSSTIIVVDDSLTVRKVTGRLLEREGCEVLVAKDGLGAIELLREVIPNVMLIDLEMPRMNGFELIRHIRQNPETTNIPIIIISSRTADKHRQMADELGVNVFLGKPYKEDDLLNHISQYVQSTQNG